MRRLVLLEDPFVPDARWDMEHVVGVEYQMADFVALAVGGENLDPVACVWGMDGARAEDVVLDSVSDLGGEGGKIDAWWLRLWLSGHVGGGCRVGCTVREGEERQYAGGDDFDSEVWKWGTDHK